MINDNPTTKREILLAEILGDTGKILVNFEKISQLIPEVSQKYNSEMKNLFEDWKKNAVNENNNIINSSVPRIKNEIRDVIQLELSNIAKKTFLEQENNIEKLISNKLDKYLYFAIFIALFIFFTGLIIGKYYIK